MHAMQAEARPKILAQIVCYLYRCRATEDITAVRVTTPSALYVRVPSLPKAAP